MKKTVLITGGSRGIGKETAKEFAKNGYNVVINYVSDEKSALSLKEELEEKYDSDVMLCKCDVSNEIDIKKMVSDVINYYGKIDVLINNAAIADDKDPLEKSALEFNRVLHTNLTGTFLVTKYAIEKMGNGSIVNISSTNGIDTYYPESIDYDASKAGIISLTHNFAKYLSDIRVNCICPDWIDTEMNKDMDEIYKAKINFIKPDVLASLVYKVAMNKGINDQIIKVGDNSVR